MEIIILLIFVMLMLAMACMDKRYPYLGVLAGIGLIVLAMAIPLTSGIQTETGSTSWFNATTNISYTTIDRTNLSTVYGIDWLDTALMIILGGVGCLISLTSAQAGGKF